MRKSFLTSLVAFCAFVFATSAFADYKYDSEFVVRLPYSSADVQFVVFNNEDGDCTVLVNFVQNTRFLDSQIVSDYAIRNMPSFTIVVRNGDELQISSLAPFGSDGGGEGVLTCTDGSLRTAGSKHLSAN